MWRGRSTPQLTEKRSRVQSVILSSSMCSLSSSSSSSSRSMMRALMLLCFTFFIVVDIEVVTSMSLDRRLGIDRFNEIRSDKQQFDIRNNDKSNLMAEGLEVEAVPDNDGETDMYVLLPARGSTATSERDSVDRNTIESDEAESIGGDMLMMESNDVPIVQVATLPIIIEKDNKVEEKIDQIKSDSDKLDISENTDNTDDTDGDGDDDDIDDDNEPIKQVFKNDKDIEDMAIGDNTKEDNYSEEIDEAKDDTENESESMVDMISDVVNDVEKEIETELLDEDSEDIVADEVKETNDEEKAKWDATVEKLELKGSEKNEDDSDIGLEEAAVVMEDIIPDEVVDVMAAADGSDSSSEENEELEKKKDEKRKEENIIVNTPKVDNEKEMEKEQVNKKNQNEGDNPKEINEDLKQDNINNTVMDENNLKGSTEDNIIQSTEKSKLDEMDQVQDMREEFMKDEMNVTAVENEKEGESNNNKNEKEPIHAENMEQNDNLSSQIGQIANEINEDIKGEEQDEASTEQPSLETVEITQSDIDKDNEVLENSEVLNKDSDQENEESAMVEKTDSEKLPSKDNETEVLDNVDGSSQINSVSMEPLEPTNTIENEEKIVELNPTVQESLIQNENINQENENENKETSEKVLETFITPVDNFTLPQKPAEQDLEDSATRVETATLLTTILQMPTTQQETLNEQKHEEMQAIQQQMQQYELPLVQGQQLHDEMPIMTEQEQEHEQEKDKPPAVEQQKENEQPAVQQEENELAVVQKDDVLHNEMQIVDSEKPNGQMASNALETTQMTIESGTQKPQIVANATEDSVFNYVNATNAMQTLHSETSQQAQQMQNATDSEDQAPFSSQLRRYDGAQVWRIVVQNDRDRRLADELQTKYDAQLWKEVKQEVDYLLKPQILAAAEKHIRAANLSRIVLIDNLQQVIEVENPPLDELADADNEKGHRLTWQAYHRLADIHDYFDYLAKSYPEICAVETIGYSVQKRPLKVLKISNGNAGNPGVWIDGGMHAREWISPASVTYVANQLSEGWDSLPSYMQNINWYIHAVANPDGYEYTHTTDRLWRKNLRSHGRQCPGVDLNRNFGFKWGGKGTSANPCSQIYRGSKAFSEPETFYISKFISSFPRDTFQAYLSFHSYGQYILYPWGYDYLLTSDGVDLDRVARAAATTITRSTGAKYTVGSSAVTLYPAAGGSDDWAKGIANIKYTYTIEMGDSGRYGFILPADQIETNGRDAYTFAQTVARAISHDARKRAMKLK